MTSPPSAALLRQARGLSPKKSPPRTVSLDEYGSEAKLLKLTTSSSRNSLVVDRQSELIKRLSGCSLMLTSKNTASTAVSSLSSDTRNALRKQLGIGTSTKITNADNVSKKQQLGSDASLESSDSNTSHESSGLSRRFGQRKIRAVKSMGSLTLGRAGSSNPYSEGTKPNQQKFLSKIPRKPSFSSSFGKIGQSSNSTRAGSSIGNARGSLLVLDDARLARTKVIQVRLDKSAHKIQRFFRYSLAILKAHREEVVYWQEEKADVHRRHQEELEDVSKYLEMEKQQAGIQLENELNNGVEAQMEEIAKEVGQVRQEIRETKDELESMIDSIRKLTLQNHQMSKTDPVQADKLKDLQDKVTVLEESQQEWVEQDSNLAKNVQNLQRKRNLFEEKAKERIAERKVYEKYVETIIRIVKDDPLLQLAVRRIDEGERQQPITPVQSNDETRSVQTPQLRVPITVMDLRIETEAKPLTQVGPEMNWAACEPRVITRAKSLCAIDVMGGGGGGLSRASKKKAEKEKAKKVKRASSRSSVRGSLTSTSSSKSLTRPSSTPSMDWAKMGTGDAPPKRSKRKSRRTNEATSLKRANSTPLMMLILGE